LEAALRRCNSHSYAASSATLPAWPFFPSAAGALPYPYAMGELQLHGMKAASTRSWPTPSSDPQPIIGDLLATEISEKQARSIKYQFTIAKLPLAKGLDDFQFEAYRSTRPSCAISPTAASSHSSVMLYCRGHRQDPPRDRDCPKLHPRRRGARSP